MVSAPLGVPAQPEIFLSVARFWLAMDVVIGDVFINTVLNSNNNKTQRILIILFGFRRFKYEVVQKPLFSFCSRVWRVGVYVKVGGL